MDKAPPAAVTPSKDGFPDIPANYGEQSLRDNRAMVRTAIRAHWRKFSFIHRCTVPNWMTEIAGGQGAVPWKEISDSIDVGEGVWVEGNRLPKGGRFVDPCELSLEECRSWLEHLSLHQSDSSEEDRHFQFRQVYACAKHEFPEYSEIVSMQKVRRANNEVNLVR